MVYIVFLRFSTNRAEARRWLDAHNEWIQRGINDHVFLLAGSLGPSEGGAVLAINADLEALRVRVNADPFVEHRVVEADIVSITPFRMSARVQEIFAAVGR
ncbi:hypothetical protein J7E49_04815 [Variovorax paradoxus]|nr:hypothetical protein [Variovorax paradoxus]